MHYSSVPGITYRGRHHQMCPKSIPKSIHTNLVNRNPIVHLSFGDFGGVMQALFLSFWGTVAIQSRYRYRALWKYRGLSLIRWSFFHVVKSASVSPQTELHIQTLFNLLLNLCL